MYNVKRLYTFLDTHLYNVHIVQISGFFLGTFFLLAHGFLACNNLAKTACCNNRSKTHIRHLFTHTFLCCALILFSKITRIQDFLSFESLFQCSDNLSSRGRCMCIIKLIISYNLTKSIKLE